jgi:hypothetical protein
MDARKNPIQVEVRIRPSPDCAIENTPSTVTVGTKTYRFNRVHLTTSQQQLYKMSAKGLVERFLEGYNCTILAYGQTGSGKTYTMGISHEDASGLLPQALKHVFRGNDVEMECTFIEIYNEEVIDLLGTHKTPLSLREMCGEITVAGVSEVAVRSYGEAMEVLQQGCLERTTKSTNMNSKSSRSHAIFTMHRRRETGGAQVMSRFSFVDLAGSERLKRTLCTGERARESISINSGLLAIGNVISALYNKSPHVPFRDSKITRILQSCLSGHVLVMACISPAHADLGETHNTLKYACRAAAIETDARMNVEVDNSRYAVMLLKKEIQKLRTENQMLRERLRKSDRAGMEELVHENRQLKARLETMRPSNWKEDTCPLVQREDQEGGCPRDVAVEPKENVMNEEKDVPCGLETKHKRVVSFDLERSTKRYALFTPRKEKIVMETAVEDRVVGHQPISMVLLSGQLVFASVDGRVRTWDGDVLFVEDGIRCLCAADILFYSARGLLKSFDPRCGTRPVYAYRSEVSALLADGDLVYTGHEDGTFCVYDRRAAGAVLSERPHSGTVFCIERAEGSVYTGSRDHGISRYDGGWSSLTPPHYDAVQTLLSHKGELVSAGRDCSLRRWRDGCIVKTVPYAHDSWIKCGASMGGSFATGSKDGAVRLWDFCSNSMFCIGKLKLGGSVNVMASSGDMLYAGSQNREVVAIRCSYAR